MSIKPVFPTIPRNSSARQQHSQYPKTFLDRDMQMAPFQTLADLVNGQLNDSFVFAAINVPAGNRVIVTRVSYSLTFFGQCYPNLTDRVFLRNGMRETSRFDYDRFANNIPLPAGLYGAEIAEITGSYPNPDTVDVYDFGNSGDTLVYAVRSNAAAGSDYVYVDPRSFVEIDYLLVPPNNDSYTNAQDL